MCLAARGKGNGATQYNTTSTMRATVLRRQEGGENKYRQMQREEEGQEGRQEHQKITNTTYNKYNTYMHTYIHTYTTDTDTASTDTTVTTDTDTTGSASQQMRLPNKLPVPPRAVLHGELVCFGATASTEDPRAAANNQGQHCVAPSSIVYSIVCDNERAAMFCMHNTNGKDSATYAAEDL